MNPVVKKTFTIIKRIISISIILLLLTIALGMISIFRKPKLNETIRSEHGGTYHQLSRGVTHYELVSPSDSAPMVVLVPGLTVPMSIFRNNTEALHQAGFATLRYDFYGRGMSDRPFLKYNAQLYTEQTIELLDSLGLSDEVHLVGISLGGAVVAEMAAKYPNRYKSVTFIDAAVAYSQEEADSQRKGVLLSRAQAFKKKENVDTTSDAYKYAPLIKEQFKYRGMELALLSIYLNENSYNYLQQYKEYALHDSIKTQIIWGENDDNFSYEHGVKLGKLISHAEFHTIPGGSHTPHFGQPEKVNPLLVDFLNRVENASVSDEKTVLTGL